MGKNVTIQQKWANEVWQENKEVKTTGQYQGRTNTLQQKYNIVEDQTLAAPPTVTKAWEKRQRNQKN